MEEACKYGKMMEFNVPLNSLASGHVYDLLVDANMRRALIAETLKNNLPRLKVLSEIPVPAIYISSATDF